ncbi:MAG TPA: hypothetical protein VI306_14650 [Pyrinomonadaceae bacterium]
MTTQNTAVTFPTVDILNSYDGPFTSSSPGYSTKSGRVRFVWSMGSLSSERRVLFQAAVQFPSYFFIFKYDNVNNIPSVTSGNVTPSYLWRTVLRGKWTKVNCVSEYLVLPKGTYVFMGQDETTGAANNECSMSMRNPEVPSQQLKYNFIESQALTGVAAEGSEAAFGPFQLQKSSPAEVYYLKGCVNQSAGGQSVEVLYEPQYLLWKDKKKYAPTLTFEHHFHTLPLNAAPNSKWYLLLKNYALKPTSLTDNPCSLSYVFERWSRA